VKAQIGLPDMKLPIQYALTYPDRVHSPNPRFSFADYPQLTFEPPDLKTFTCLELACEACCEGGNRPCVLNAANEVAVAQFLHDKIKFTDIPKRIEKALSSVPFAKPDSVEAYLATDKEVRNILNDK
jgi:1-deoxy-D-xylulose-5-phosphate reductoisomerase